MNIFFASALSLLLGSASAAMTAETAETAALRGTATALVEGVAVTDAWGDDEPIAPIFDPCPPFLDSITGMADAAVHPLAFAFTGLDPIILGDQHQFSLPEFSIPATDCVAAADLNLNLGKITGLASTDFSVVQVDSANSHCEFSLLGAGSFEATWRLQKTLEDLAVTVSTEINSEACGQGFDGKGVGSVALPHARLSVDFKIGGSTGGIGALPIAEVSVVQLVKIELVLANIVLSANVTSNLGNVGVEHEVEDWIKEDVVASVSTAITTVVNNHIGDFLPISLPPMA